MPTKVKENREVKVETVDVARLVSQGGATFFATFNRTDKTCEVLVGDSPHRNFEAQTVRVSYATVRAFAKLLLKQTKGD